MKIGHLISINGAILMVYYTSGKCYQYAIARFGALATPIAFYDGSIYQPNELYYTAEEALKVGIDCIKIVIGYQ
jgi:hypothetical protein